VVMWFRKPFVNVQFCFNILFTEKLTSFQKLKVLIINERGGKSHIHIAR
jgi:hypothetical protein